jgi:hypothetical protein
VDRVRTDDGDDLLDRQRFGLHLGAGDAVDRVLPAADEKVATVLPR